MYKCSCSISCAVTQLRISTLTNPAALWTLRVAFPRQELTQSLIYNSPPVHHKVNFATFNLIIPSLGKTVRNSKQEAQVLVLLPEYPPAIAHLALRSFQQGQNLPKPGKCDLSINVWNKCNNFFSVPWAWWTGWFDLCTLPAHPA